MFHFMHPFTAIVAGPSGCGKSHFVTNFIKYMKEICPTSFNQITWCYDEMQSLYNLKNINYYQGIPDLNMFNGIDPHLIIIDDLMRESDGRIVDIFTKGANLYTMNTIEVKGYLSKNHPTLSTNVFAANRLPLYMKTPTYLISHLDPDSEPGSHWVGIHIDRNGFGQYFDSYGRPPTGYHKDFLRRNAKNWDFNRYRMQHYLSSVCGEYSLAYLYNKYHGNTFEDFLKLFSENTLLNDIVVLEVLKL